jgi:para-nitrobenzyl esterase
MLWFARSTRSTLVGALALVLLLASSAQANLDGPLAATDKGFLRGSSTPSMHVFKGIPYAAPPVGPLRWQPPQPAPRWRGFRDATAFAPHCAQPPSPFGVVSTSEDCLYLNVYVPKRSHGNVLPLLRPVMVWIHGGALFLGESDDYDPTRLVDEGVIVVTLNYRLGLLGFLAHPALSAESSYGGSGNYGIMDQQAALEWVKRNILLFGGDPRNVTIFGESAGGLSVHTHLASPESAGLFDQVIAQSGAYALAQAPLAAAEAAGTGYATAAGCPDQSASCLRSVPVTTFFAVQGGGGFVPNLDNHVLTQTMQQAFASGDFNQVPVLEGSTHDEWRLFVALNQELVSGPLTPAQYPGAIASTLFIPLPAATAIATFVYPLAAYPSPSVALGAVGTDAIFACNARIAAGLLSQHVPTFAYEFNDPNAPQRFLPPVSFPYGASHASELQYLFELSAPFPSPGLTPPQQALAGTMVKYWSRFAKRGDPNSASAPVWPGYDSASDTHLSLAPSAVQTTTGFAADHKCDFWAAP